MLTKVLAALILVLTISLGSVGYLYTGSLKENGRLSGDITTLTENLENCQKDVKDVKGEKEDVVESFETVKKESKESQEAFKELEDRLNDKKCGAAVAKNTEKSTTNEQTKAVDPVVDDIADTLGVLRRAYCLSNGDASCKDS